MLGVRRSLTPDSGISELVRGPGSSLPNPGDAGPVQITEDRAVPAAEGWAWV